MAPNLVTMTDLARANTPTSSRYRNILLACTCIVVCCSSSIANAGGPLVTPPENVKITCKDPTDPGFTGAATCSDTGTPTFTDVVTGNCPVIITRTWTCTSRGGSSSADQIITINDDFPPVLTMPDNVKITCKDPTDPGFTGVATCSDNCDPNPINATFTDVVTGNCPVIITRTWTCMDKCGNTSSADQIITINDNIPPLLTLPADVEIACSDSTDPLFTGVATCSDNCDPHPLTVTFADATPGTCPGIITRTWTCTDQCGNSNTAPQTITINNDVPLECDNFDVVFVVDTSGSIQDEGAALCANINQLVIDLGALGLPVNATLLGILDNPPGSSFGCLTDSVSNLLGAEVPGTPPACCPTMTENEDWGAATAIVADRFPWQTDAVRVIIPISDEGPEDGDQCADPGFDRASITNAINLANANNVLVAPITGTGSNPCALTLAGDLADGTGGASFASTDPSADLVSAIGAILIGLCGGGPVSAPVQLDLCPGDPDKIDPGVCGCGIPDADDNADGTTDCIEIESDGATTVSPDPACSLCGTVGVAFYFVTLTAYALLLFTRRRRR